MRAAFIFLFFLLDREGGAAERCFFYFLCQNRGAAALQKGGAAEKFFLLFWDQNRDAGASRNV